MAKEFPNLLIKGLCVSFLQILHILNFVIFFLSTNSALEDLKNSLFQISLILLLNIFPKSAFGSSTMQHGDIDPSQLITNPLHGQLHFFKLL